MQPRPQTGRPAPTGSATVVGDPLTGRLLDGRYRIGRRIARGGMAGVYEATDVRLDRTVAIKVMHPGLGDDQEFAARFVHEARAAARLSHPHVVAVYDQGEDQGTVYLAMELVPGRTLRDVVREESPLRPARALRLLEPVLSALAAAHRAGLVHRDVKPENVLIGTDPDTGATQVKVADFGLAKAVSADTQHTATGGVLIGTVSYLAPELVVDGRSDARADVYAAGVVLFELLTGEKPHEGESPIQVAYKHVHADVPAPSSLVPGIPAYVDALVARATARDRAARPADAGVLLHQVRRVATALAEGLDDDPDLTADLTPLLLARPGTAGADDAAPHGGAGDPAGGVEPTDLIPVLDPADLPAAAPLPAEPPPPRRAPARPTGSPGRPARPGRSRRGPVLLLLALVLVVAAGAGAWWFGWARYTSAPGVIGLDRADAVAKVRAAGLDAEVGDPAYSETVPKGRVLSTDPAAGSRVLDDGTVTLVLSLGKERYDVPKLHGLTEDAAQDRLTSSHLGFGGSTGRWSEKVPEGQVITSVPARGTRLRPDTAVDLVLSKGPRPIQLRDWTGKSADQAQQWFESKGLQVDRSTVEFSDSVADGDVISQEPTGGTLHRGDTVRLVVSKGPELVEVPGGLVASGVDAATEQLESLGFQVEVHHASEWIGLSYVFKVDPGSGSMVPKGSVVVLYLI